jgi:hypothetical protein
MYEEVALEAGREFRFETGRALAERLGFPPDDLDRMPAASIDPFAGLGYFLELAVITADETVLDLGTGSGMDSFLAANQVGPHRTRDRHRHDQGTARPVALLPNPASRPRTSVRATSRHRRSTTQPPSA